MAHKLIHVTVITVLRSCILLCTKGRPKDSRILFVDVILITMMTRSTG